MNLNTLTHSEFERLKSKLNLNEDELKLIELLASGKYSDEGIMLNMHISRNKFYQIKKNISDKILRAAAE